MWCPTKPCVDFDCSQHCMVHRTILNTHQIGFIFMCSMLNYSKKVLMFREWKEDLYDFRWCFSIVKYKEVLWLPCFFPNWQLLFFLLLQMNVPLSFSQFSKRPTSAWNENFHWIVFFKVCFLVLFFPEGKYTQT